MNISELVEQRVILSEEENDNFEWQTAALIGAAGTYVVVARDNIKSLLVKAGKVATLPIRPLAINPAGPEKISAKVIEDLTTIPAVTKKFKVNGKTVHRVLYPSLGYHVDLPTSKQAKAALTKWASTGEMTNGPRSLSVANADVPRNVRKWAVNSKKSARMSVKRLASSIEIADWQKNSKIFKVLRPLTKYGVPLLILADFIDNIIFIIAEELEKPEHEGDVSKALIACMSEVIVYIGTVGPEVAKQFVQWWVSVMAVTKVLQGIITVIFNSARVLGLASGPAAPFVWIGSLVGQLGFSIWATTDHGQRTLNTVWIFILKTIMPTAINDAIESVFGSKAAELITPKIDSEWGKIMDQYSTVDPEQAKQDAGLDNNGQLPASTTPATTAPSAPAASKQEIYKGLVWD